MINAASAAVCSAAETHMAVRGSFMSTVLQCVGGAGKRVKKRPLGRMVRLRGCPAARGIVSRVAIRNPKKPNSAMRQVAKLRVYRKPRITARLPGSGFGVARYNRVLARGGRANDLPGINYSLIRGVYDFPSLFGKKKSRSFYGIARDEARAKYVRRKARKKL